jgi:hypothetical protein
MKNQVDYFLTLKNKFIPNGSLMISVLSAGMPA